MSTVAWQDLGACRGIDQSVFFPRTRGAANTAEALNICQDCTVADECLTHALSVPEVDGVWGGKTEEERRLMLPRRTRQSRARCGTEAGAARHRANGEDLCGACREGASRARRRRWEENERVRDSHQQSKRTA